MGAPITAVLGGSTVLWIISGIIVFILIAIFIFYTVQ
jgi:hypothetical protein